MNTILALSNEKTIFQGRSSDIEMGQQRYFGCNFERNISEYPTHFAIESARYTKGGELNIKSIDC